MRKRKFVSIKYTQSYSYAKFRPFFMNHQYKGIRNCAIYSTVANRIVTRLYTWTR